MLRNFLRNIVSPLSLKYGISMHAKTAISQYLCHTNAMRTFHFVEIFRFVEMKSTFFLIFRRDGNFLIKFCSSDSSFNRNILRSLYLKFKASAHAHIAIAYYYALFTNFLTWYEFLKLSLVYILINEVGQWFYQLDHVTFSKNIFWSVNWTLFYNQIYSVQMSSLYLVEGLPFKVRNCTPFIKSYLPCKFPSDTMSWNSHIVWKNE